MRRFSPRLLLPVLVVLLLIGPARAEPDIHDTRLLTQPAVSAKHIAFIYADDLWVADLDGTNVRRLTSDIGVESHPVFSPDGKTIAFSAQYEGNTDVYIIPVEGGSPKRLTWHPGVDIVRGFTPDGKAVVFSSPRQRLHRPVHAALHGPGRRRHADPVADPQRRRRHRSRPTASASPTRPSPTAASSGSTTAAAPARASGSTT